MAVPFRAVIGSCTGLFPVDSMERLIVIDIRLPRVLLAFLVGAGLSVAGAVLQALLRNPLAEPYILGISSGGTMGTILAIALASGIRHFVAPAASFAGSALVMVLVYALAHRRGQLEPYTLLLAGVMVGAFFNALVLLTVAMFNQELRNAFLWLMGNLSGASMEALLIAGPLTLLATIPAFMYSRQYNLIATGDETALQLGVDVRALRRRSYAIASVITGAVVSVSGVVGFVGTDHPACHADDLRPGPPAVAAGLVPAGWHVPDPGRHACAHDHRPRRDPCRSCYGSDRRSRVHLPSPPPVGNQIGAI